MKLLYAEVENFGSYGHLEFNFEDLGLSLIYGATGSGKSTLEDIATWILYGITSKNGSVDDIRNWNNKDLVTKGTIKVQLSDNSIVHVTRLRGKAQQNDLHWTENPNGDPIRGKDITDTQRLLEQKIGVSAELYCMSACFNEFSTAGTFFTAKNKDKREVFEKIASLELPAKLADATSSYKKELKKSIDFTENQLVTVKAKLWQANETKISTTKLSAEWTTKHNALLEDLRIKSKHFEKEKVFKIEELQTKSYKFFYDRNKRIDDLTDKLEDLDQQIKPVETIERQLDQAIRKSLVAPKCPTCHGFMKHNDNVEKLKIEKAKNNDLKDRFKEYSARLLELQQSLNPYTDQLRAAENMDNHYDKRLQYEASNNINPFIPQLHILQEQSNKLIADERELTNTLESLKYKLDATQQLYDLSFELRGILLNNAIKQAETKTNDSLQKYFDSELKVMFDLKEADALSVYLYKNGNTCVYQQLSKGQRQLLKLCFATSIMYIAANNAGIHFSTLFFDEALDGFDSDLKVKAFSLFQDMELNHDSILVIDHSSELQSLFNKKYHVTMQEDNSYIKEHA